jgi:DNA-binding ferritin-like protein
MGILRKHIQHAKTFQERLTEEAQRLKGLAEQTPDGKTRELLLKRARQAETASYMDSWLSCQELRPTK